ncbi:MAG: hypothetical protein MPJ50_05940 [Pirellulales bacterium]|nr:hypothetical protein [Pirellulales bacterium]
MANSFYVQHTRDQLPTETDSEPDEGQIFPLLRRFGTSGNTTTWAYAVPKRRELGDPPASRKNLLTCGILRAIGFVPEGSNTAPVDKPWNTRTELLERFDFFYLKDEILIPKYAPNVFAGDTLPDIPNDSGPGVEVLNPKGTAASLLLAGDESAAGQDSTFLVDQFEIQSSTFTLGLAGQATAPEFDATVALTSSSPVKCPAGAVPTLSIEQLTTGFLRVNGQKAEPNNDKATPRIATDTRHDRLALDVATLVSLASELDLDATVEPTRISLAIEVFPAFSFRPDPNLPISVAVGNRGITARLMPSDGDYPFPTTISVNRLQPCVRVTIRGPMIHAKAEATGPSEWLSLLEPANRKLGETVEQINDLLTYNFDLCLPPPKIPALPLPDLFKLEGMRVRVPSLNDFPRFRLGELLDRFVLPAVDFAQFEISGPQVTLKLPSWVTPDWAAIHFPAPADVDLWMERLRIKRPGGFLEFGVTPLPAIDSVVPDIGGLELTLNLTGNLPSLTLGIDTFELRVPELEAFEFELPDLGLPSLTDFEAPDFSLDLPNKIIRFMLPEGFRLADLPALDVHLWTIRVRGLDGLAINLDIDKLERINDLEVKLTLKVVPPELPSLSGLFKLEIAWRFDFDAPNLNSPELKLKTKLPEVLLPKLAAPDAKFGEFDFRLLKLRLRKQLPDLRLVDIGTFPLLGLLPFQTPDFLTLKLDIPEVDGEYPDLKLFKGGLGLSVEISLDLSLSLEKCYLTDLLGELPSVDFRMSLPPLNVPTLSIGKIKSEFHSPELPALFVPFAPFELTVRIPHPTLPELQWNELRLNLGLQIDLDSFRLAAGRIYFFLPQLRSGDPLADRAPRQVIDFDIFTITFPTRPETDRFPTEKNHDGYLDLQTREFVIDLVYPKEPGAPPEDEDPKVAIKPRIRCFFPGGMNPKAARLGRDGVENLKGTADYSELRTEYAKRFELELDLVEPSLLEDAQRLFFRLNGNGLTLGANLSKSEVEVDNSGFNDDGEMADGKAGLLKPFKFDPQEKQGELESRLVVVDNELREAGVYAKTEVPGVDDLIAEVSVVLRQPAKGKLPDVIASMELERSDEAPLAELSIKLLELTLERIEMGLTWRGEEKDWDYSVIADGTLAFTGAADLVEDLEDLRAPSMQLIGLDLRRLNLREMRVPLDLVDPVRFEILDGMFAVELGDLELGWVFEGRVPKPRLLACEYAKIEYLNPGALEVAITVGGLHIEFDEDLKAHIKLPSSLGFEMALASTAKCAGSVGWVETEVERYLSVTGKIQLQGLPEISGLVKFGTGDKDSGRQEINLVLYGETELDEQLYTGVVVKSLGLGIGLNNRLKALPPKPSADAIIERIDTVKPGEVDPKGQPVAWAFVREGGFYASIIGSTIIGSNLGESDVLNAYLCQLVVSFDSNLDLVAAGKLWLSCSLDGLRDHPDNPAFVGAMVLSPRQQKLELVLQSRPNPYIEENDLMEKLLSKVRVRFAFRMTPQLVDYHLSELSYRDRMFGADVAIIGEYRFAVFKRAVLLKSELSATGTIKENFSAGPGGFDMEGQAHLHYGYGGLLTTSGAMAYAFIDAGLRFRVSAWIEIGFSISFKICGKRKTIRWTVVFRTRIPELELSFRGNIGLADRDGLIGFELQVGINIPICGYRLRASGRWDVNSDLYHDVRARVAAFERELDEAVRKLNAENAAARQAQRRFEAFLTDMGLATHRDRFLAFGDHVSAIERDLFEAHQQFLNHLRYGTDFQQVEAPSQSLRAGLNAVSRISARGARAARALVLEKHFQEWEAEQKDFALRFRRSQPPTPLAVSRRRDAFSKTFRSAQEPRERWLLYRREQASGSLVSLLHPAEDSKWLTPRIQSVRSVTVFRVEDVKVRRVVIDAPDHSLSNGNQVRLLGMRGPNLPGGLDAAWTVTSAGAGTFEIDLSSATITAPAILQNSGFEAWPNGRPQSWNVDSGTIGTHVVKETTLTELHQGRHALKLVGDGSIESIRISQSIPRNSFTPGQRHCVSCFVKGDASITQGKLTIQFESASGEPERVPSGKIELDHTTLATLAAYEEQEFCFSVPTNVPDDLELVIEVTETLTSGAAIRIDAIADTYDVPMFGGVWYPEVAPNPNFRGLSAEDHETVYYYDDVERVALRTGSWKTVAKNFEPQSVGSNQGLLTTRDEHGFKVGTRLIVKSDQPADVKDYGRFRQFGKELEGKDYPQLTAEVLTVEDAHRVKVWFPPEPDDKKDDAGDFPSYPLEDWQVAAAIELAPHWNARNRLAELAVRKDLNDYRTVTGEAAGWAETAARAGQANVDAPDHSAFAVVFDERFESDDPRFSPPEVAASLPPGVLSTRFERLDDVEIVGADEVLDSARRYQIASAALARQELHDAGDLNTAEALHQSRAQFSQQLLHNLTDPRGAQGDDRTRLADFTTGVGFGWLWDTSITPPESTSDNDVLFVRRTGGSATAAKLEQPTGASAQPIDVSLLPIRQDFAVDKDSERSREGRLVVRLPVRIDDNALRRRLSKVGLLQVFRQVGEQQPEPLTAAPFRPEISFLNSPQIYSLEERAFVGDEHEESRGPLHPISTAVVDGDQLEAFEVAEDIWQALPDPPVSNEQDVLEGFGLRVYWQPNPRSEEHKSELFRIRAIERPTRTNVTVTLDPPIDSTVLPDDTLVSLELVAYGLIVPRPTAISDEFEVADAQFLDPKLAAEAGPDGLVRVRYGLRLVDEDDAGKPFDLEAERATGRYQEWDQPVPLFIPPESPTPLRLALAMPVDSLLLDPSNKDAPEPLKFQLVNLSGETPALAAQDGRLLEAEDFELFVEKSELQQSGFYAGEGSVADGPQQPRDSSRLTLDDVATASELRSTFGLRKIEVRRVVPRRGPIYFETASDATGYFQAGYAYRLFVRARGMSGVDRTSEMQLLLVRELPLQWSGDVRFRQSELLERIPQADLDDLLSEKADPLTRDFSADELYEHGRNSIRAVWPSSTVQDGGVELQLRDFDDSSVRGRVLCEVVEAGEFQKTPGDFRDESLWAPRSQQQFERFASPVRALATKITGSEFKPFYILLTEGESLPAVVQAIKNEATKLVAAAQERERSWEKIANAAANLQTTLLQFEKSPLNFETPAARALLDIARMCLRSLLVGNLLPVRGADVPPGTSAAELRKQLEAIRTADAGLVNLVRDIEQAKPETIGQTANDETAFLDRDTATRLAGIVRRRLALASDTVGLRGTASSPSNQQAARLSLIADTDAPLPLVRQEAWLSQLQDSKSMSASLPLTDKLAALFGAVAWENTRELNAAALHALQGELNDQLDKNLPKTVSQAAGLTDFLNRLQARLDGGVADSPAAVLKRPHHQLTTTKREDGEIVARPLPLRSMLPADARGTQPGTVPPLPDNRTSRLAARVGRLAILTADGDVTIWTARGNALGEPAERMQFFSAANRGHEDFGSARIQLSEDLDGPLVLIDARARQGQAERAVDLWNAATGTFLRQLNEGAAAPGAKFADTPRGLEVLLVEAATSGSQPQPHAVVARPVDASRAPTRFLSFNDNQDADTYPGIVAYHDELKMVAARATREISSVMTPVLVLWRDLGRPEHRTPAHVIALSLVAQLQDIQPVTLPTGARFVLATSDTIHLLDPISGEVVLSEGAGAAVSGIAVDRRGLTVAVRMAAGELRVFDLAASTWRDDPQHNALRTSRGVALLHSNDESYAAVADGPETRCFEIPVEGRPQSVQTLPHGVPLYSAPTATSVVSIATDLQAARTAKSAAELVNLFHLWERMGFALDIAAQDSAARLLPLAALRGEIDRVLYDMRNGSDHGSIPVNRNEPHYAFLVEGEEHDAQFKDSDTVGFAHAKVAIVPAKFLAAAHDLRINVVDCGFDKSRRLLDVSLEACPRTRGNARHLEVVVLAPAIANPVCEVVLPTWPDKLQLPETQAAELGDATQVRVALVARNSTTEKSWEPLRAWLTYRSIVPTETDNPADDGINPESLVELLHVAQLTRLAGVPTTNRFGEPTEDAQTAAVRESSVQRLQPRSERFLTVPSSAGFSHASWVLPDRKGHRMLAAARRVSRYEPLLRWDQLRHFRLDLPEEISLSGDMTNATFSDNTVRLPAPLPLASGRQPLVLEIIRGPGAGQRREVVVVDEHRTQLEFDAGDLWLTTPTTASRFRVIDAAPGWRQVDIDPVHDPALGEGAQPLMVYQYPHSRQLQFSFQIPLDGMRATYNQISRVRTGYQGVDTAYRYFLPERPQPSMPALTQVLGAVVAAQAPDPNLAPIFSLTTLPALRELIVRLFRHEKMVRLPELPYFYRYRLDARSVYAARRLEHDRITAAEMLPEDDNLSPPAERKPTKLGLVPAQVRRASIIDQDGDLAADSPGTTLEVGFDTSGLFHDQVGRRVEVSPDGGTTWLASRVILAGSESQTVRLNEPFDVMPLAGWPFRILLDAYDVALIISANRDHLTQEESESEPDPVQRDFTASVDTVGGRQLTVNARDLPDFVSDYGIYYRTPADVADPLPSQSDLFTRVATVRQPWSVEFKPPDGFPLHIPFVQMDTGTCGRDTAVFPLRPGDGNLQLSTASRLTDQLGDGWPTGLASIQVRSLDEPIRHGTMTLDAHRWHTIAFTNDLALSSTGSEATVQLKIATVARGNALPVVIEHVLASGRAEPYWRLQFQILRPPADTTIVDPQQFFIQGLRQGQPERAEAAQ